MASISETIQNIISAITGLFRPKPSLNTMSQDDLTKEKTILEQNENKILREMKRLEEQKVKLFEEAKREPSESMRRAKARQIRDIDQRIRGMQATLGPLGQRISVLDRFISMHEMGNFAPNSSEVIDALRRTDAQQIQQDIDNQLAADLMQEEKLNDMAETFKTAQERDEALYEEDEELMSIMTEIESAAVMDASVEEAALLKEQAPSQRESAPADMENPMKE